MRNEFAPGHAQAPGELAHAAAETHLVEEGDVRMTEAPKSLRPDGLEHRHVHPFLEAVHPGRERGILAVAAPDRTASQVTNQCAESGDRRMDESGDRRAVIATPQACREGYLTRG